MGVVFGMVSGQSSRRSAIGTRGLVFGESFQWKGGEEMYSFGNMSVGRVFGIMHS